jgi:hypothetical protein
MYIPVFMLNRRISKIYKLDERRKNTQDERPTEHWKRTIGEKSSVSK